MAAHIVLVGGSDDWNNELLVFKELSRAWIAHPGERIIVRHGLFQYRDGPHYWASEWARNMRECGYDIGSSAYTDDKYWRHVIDVDSLIQFCRVFREVDRQAQRLARAADVPIAAPLWQPSPFAAPRKRVLVAH
jgi:hypothetical protein